MGARIFLQFGWIVALLAAVIPVARSIDPIRTLIIYEANNQDAERAFKAVNEYVVRTKIPGLTLANASRVMVDSTQKFLTIEDVCSVYDKTVAAGTPPHLVLDLTGSGISSDVMKVVTKNLGLPTVSGSFGTVNETTNAWAKLTAIQNQYLVQVMPPSDVIPQMLAVVTGMQTLTNAVVLYDDTFDLSTKYKTVLNSRSIRHLFNRIETGNINQQLRRLVDMELVNFYVMGKVNSINQVLLAASQENFFGKKYSWFIISKDMTGDPFVRTDNSTITYSVPTINANISGGLLHKTSGMNTTTVDSGFYFDLILRAVTAVKNMMENKTWPTDMVYSPCSALEKKPIERQNLNLRKAFNEVNVGSTFAPFVLNGNGRSFPQVQMNINELTYMRGRVQNRNAIGVWRAGLPGNITFSSGKALTPAKISDVLRVAVVIQPPFVNKRKRNDSTTEFYGLSVDLLEEIRRIVDFDYELYEVPDGKYGTMDDKFKWNGMVRELVEKRADIGLGALAVLAERETVIDYTVPYYDLVGIAIMMSLPAPSTSLFKFLTVLENDVWGCILAAYFFTSILLWIFDRWSPYSYQNNKEKYINDPEEEKREFTLKEALWFCITSLTPQGGGESPKHLSGRLIAATWWLFGFIIIASYTANLAAFLTVSRLDSPINSLEDLASQYKVLYAPQNGTDVAIYFERMAFIEKRFYEIWKDMSLNDSMSEIERSKLAVWDYPVSDKYTKIWQSMRDAGLPHTFQEALARVRASSSESDGFAFLGDSTDIRYQVLVNCDLQIVGEEFSRKPYALAVQEGSPLRDTLNDAILRLLNLRKIEVLKERWWTNNPEKAVCDPRDDSDGINIQNIGGVFIVIFVGIAMAFITLAIEFCYYGCRKVPPKEMETGSTTTIVSSNDPRRMDNKDDMYGKGKPFVVDPDGKKDQYTPEYGYYGAKKEAEREEQEGPRPRKAW